MIYVQFCFLLGQSKAKYIFSALPYILFLENFSACKNYFIDLGSVVQSPISANPGLTS